MKATTTFFCRTTIVFALLGLSLPAFAGEWIAFGDATVKRARAAGCAVISSHQASGLALLECDDATAPLLRTEAKLAIAPNIHLSMIEPVDSVFLAETEAASPPFTGDDDFLFDFQWGHTAVRATDAWEQGYRGEGVTVAMLDSGIDCGHPDLYANVIYGLAASFYPGQHVCEVDYAQGSHGTFTSGIVAAPDNGLGVIGVAPEAWVVPVKVCDSYSPDCDLYAIWSGMLYAADIGADLVNMSLGGALPRRGFVDDYGTRVNANEVQFYFNTYNAIARYLWQRGTVVIAAAGNDAVNAEHDADVVWMPAEAQHVIAVSATGPQGWVFNPFTDLDVPAFYTNYGRSLIDLAAPGGNLDFDLYEAFIEDGWDICMTYYGVPCFAFDFVLSTEAGGWGFAAGTSAAAPYVTGVAALILSAAEEDLTPTELEAILRATADDLGETGRDHDYGLGRVNAYRAVTE